MLGVPLGLSVLSSVSAGPVRRLEGGGCLNQGRPQPADVCNSPAACLLCSSPQERHWSVDAADPHEARRTTSKQQAVSCSLEKQLGEASAEVLTLGRDLTSTQESHSSDVQVQYSH